MEEPIDDIVLSSARVEMFWLWWRQFRRHSCGLRVWIHRGARSAVMAEHGLHEAHASLNMVTGEVHDVLKGTTHHDAGQTKCSTHYSFLSRLYLLSCCTAAGAREIGISYIRNNSYVGGHNLSRAPASHEGYTVPVNSKKFTSGSKPCLAFQTGVA